MKIACSLFAVVVVASLTACSSSDDNADTSAVALDGVYQGDANSGYAWASFHDDNYALWKSGSACAATGASAEACGEAGTYTLDADSHTLTLTNGATGAAQVLHIDIAASSGPSALVTQTLTPRAAGIVGNGQQLNQDGSSGLVATQFAVYQPSSDSLVQQVDFRSATFALLQYCAILLGNPADKKIEQPPPPPAITQTCGSR